MSYQTTTKTSYGSKVGSAFKNTFVGVMLIIIGTIAIFWNENRAIKTYRTINDSEKHYVEMPDITQANPDFNGKIVHCTGKALTDAILSDANFGVAVNGLHLERKVEYFQYVEKSHSEEKEKIGGGSETTTTYTYETMWVDEPVLSSNFNDPGYKNSNFVNAIVEKKEWDAENVSFGAYNLPPFIVGQIIHTQPASVNMTDSIARQWEADITERLNERQSISGGIGKNAVGQLSLFDDTVVDYVHTQGNTVYFGKTPNNPTIGDVRVSFSYTPNDQQVSIIAKVNNNTFEHFTAKNKCSFSAVELGDVSAEAMFETARQGNKIITWIIRIILIIIIIGGFKATTGLLPTLLKVLPFLGKGVGAILGFVSTVIGIIWSLLWIGIAWITVRPIIAIILLVVIIGLIVLIRKRSKKVETTQPSVS